MDQTFSKITVLEIASVLAGPSVGQFFAELGAEVIKVENMKVGGDVTRRWTNENEHPEAGISAYFSAVNWGKKSIAIDLSSSEGTTLIHQMIEHTDIVISSFKHGDDKKLKVDYDTVKKINPSIIYGHITGYGTEDPRTGYDAIIQAESGFMYMNGSPGGESLKMPVALVDLLAAHQLKEGILVSFINRLTKREAKYVHVSLFDAAISALANQATNWLVAGRIPRKMGQEHPSIVPYGKSFETKDGKNILLAIGTDKQFQFLCDIISEPELALDPKYRSNPDRVQNRNSLYLRLIEKIKELNSKSFKKSLLEKSIPFGEINSMDQVFDLNEAKKMIISDPAASFKGVKNIAFSDGQSQILQISGPPKYGEHTDSLLTDLLKKTEEEISALRRQGIVE